MISNMRSNATFASFMGMATRAREATAGKSEPVIPRTAISSPVVIRPWNTDMAPYATSPVMIRTLAMPDSTPILICVFPKENTLSWNMEYSIRFSFPNMSCRPKFFMVAIPVIVLMKLLSVTA